MLHYFPVQNDITPKGKSLPSCGITCTDDSRNTHRSKYSQCIVLFSVGQFISDLLYVNPKNNFYEKINKYSPIFDFTWVFKGLRICTIFKGN